MRLLACSFLSCLIAFGCGGGETTSSSAPTTGSGGTTTTTTTGGGGAGGTTTTTSTTTGEAGSGGTPTTTSMGGGGAGGAGGTGGETGGAGGAGGGTTTSTTSTTTTSDDCVWGGDCGPGNKYCFAPGCGNGVCIQKPAPAGLPPDPTPVCGCDGVTYWNAEVAASHGMSLASEGPCSMVIACGPDTPCPDGMKCNRPVADQASCALDVMGECWGTALSCPLTGPMGRACTTATCELQCSLIQSQNPWFEDPTCN